MNTSEKRFIPVMLTPFSNTGYIDYDGLTNLVDFYLDSGVSGLFANCLSSEMFELSHEERIKTVQHTVNIANGRVPVIATGTFGGTVAHQADFIKEIYDTGVEAVIIITSVLVGEQDSDEQLDERVFELFDRTGDIPLGFYECPMPYKRLLSVNQLKRYVATGRIVYHKDTSLDIEQVSQKNDATQGQNFGLYDAYMGHAVKSLKAGSAGLSSIQGNFFPELLVWLCRNYSNVDIQKEVNSVQEFLNRHMDVMHNVYPLAAKYFLQKRGVSIATFTRRYSGLLDRITRENMHSLFEEYEILRQEINIGT